MEEKRIYYVGIDHGNHLMKTSNHVFENGVERQAVKPTFQANTLVYDGAFYKIGEKRNSVKDSKLADDDYYLLNLRMWHMILPLKMYWHFRSVMQQWQTGLAV